MYNEEDTLRWFLAFAAVLLGLLCPVATWSVEVGDKAVVEELLSTDEQFLHDTLEQLADADLQSLSAPTKDGRVDKAAHVSKLVSSPNDSDREVAAKRRTRSDYFKSLNASQRAMLVAAGQRTLEERRTVCADKKPAIHTIGWHPTFTFEEKATARDAASGPRAVRIPVEGYDLNPPCVTVSVQIEGTIPVSRYGSVPWRTGGGTTFVPDFYITRPSDDLKDGLNIILLESYIDRLHTGDKVAIKVMAANRFAKPKPRAGTDTGSGGGSTATPAGARRVAIARRVFTAYSVDAYRNEVLKSRIQPDDLNAFPLPDLDARALFGSLIADNYFVVRVSIRNTGDDAKLISTGMIRASGTAMIEPKVSDEPSFSVPVSVVPHSLAQIYSVLTDEEVDQPRHRTFRGLEFVGALGAAALGVFNYGPQAARNVALFAGVIVPEGKKLWPDRWPGYQRNIVNFAMPDLLKVPAKSVADHRFLFFSKKELDGLVSDPNLFAAKSVPDNLPFAGDRRDKSRPDAFVIALAFDSLDIRFESVFTPPTSTAREVLRDVSVTISTTISELDQQRAWITTSASAFSGLTAGAYSKLNDSLTALTKVTDADPDSKNTKELAISLLALLKGMEPKSTKSPIAVNLYGAQTGLPALQAARDRANDLAQRMNGGVDPELLRPDVDALDKRVKVTLGLLRFYQECATAFKDLVAPASDATSYFADGKPKPDQLEALRAFNTMLEAKLEDLRAKKPAEVTASL